MLSNIHERLYSNRDVNSYTVIEMWIPIHVQVTLFRYVHTNDQECYTV